VGPQSLSLLIMTSQKRIKWKILKKQMRSDFLLY